MSAAQHTPGPWIRDTRGYPHPDVRAASGRKIACTWGVNNQPKTKEAQEEQKQVARANARRIVACVNACEGLSTEALERSDVLAAGLADRRALATQRDELLAALQELAASHVVLLKTNAVDTGCKEPDEDDLFMRCKELWNARAAIAKATGQEGGAA